MSRFFVAVKSFELTLSLAHQNTQLLDGFFERTELLVLTGVESFVLAGQKETEVKVGLPLWFCSIFALCLSNGSPLPSSFIGNWFLTVFYRLY